MFQVIIWLIIVISTVCLNFNPGHVIILYSALQLLPFVTEAPLAILSRSLQATIIFIKVLFCCFFQHINIW